MAKLLVINGNDLGKEFLLKRGKTMSIGRDAQNHIRLRDREVSRVHSIITSSNDGYLITDQNSSNGTFVNERRVSKHLLEASELIRVGKTSLLFEMAPLQSSVDPRELVRIEPDQSEDSVARILETIDARVALPNVEDDSQITDSFIDHIEQNIHVIYQTAIATSRYMKIDQLLQKVLQLIFDWVQADRGCILLLDESTQEIKPAAFRAREQNGQEGPIAISESILEYVRTRNEGVRSSKNPLTKRADDSSTGGDLNWFESLCVPMYGRMGTVGFIYVDAITPSDLEKKVTEPFESQFSKQQLKMLLAVGHQAALAIENAHYYQAMNQNAQLAAVGETFTQIAHHIRNMLQGLDDAKRRVNTGIAGQDQELIQEGWREIEPLTSKIYNLSLNLLSFSKPREPNLANDDLNSTVQDVVDKVEATATDRGVKIDWEPNEDLTPMAFDAEAIYQAVLNVVQNAVDASAADGVIKLRIVCDESEAEIIVIDDGEGIDPNEIKTIFKPFASTKGALGTGIGLPVAKKILREHGGDIDVASALGHGSRFTLRLPVRRIRPKGQRTKSDTSMQKARPEG